MSDLHRSHTSRVRLTLVSIACVGIVLGGSIGCGHSQSQPPATKPPSSATMGPSVPSATRSPSPSAPTGPDPVVTVPAERPVVVVAEALASDPVLVYSTPRDGGGIDFYTYSRETRTIVGAFGLSVDVRVGTPKLRGRTLVVPVDHSVVIVDLQGNIFEAVATLASDETVVGLALSSDGTMLAIGILSQVTTDSRLVVVELSSNRGFCVSAKRSLQRSLLLAPPHQPVGSQATPEWSCGPRSVRAPQPSRGSARTSPATSPCERAGRAESPRMANWPSHARAGPSELVTAQAWRSRRCDWRTPATTPLSSSCRSRIWVVSASFVAPRGPGVLYSTSPLRGDCWDNLASETWHLWDGITDSPVSDPEAVLRNWYGSRLVELECEGTRSAWQFVRNSADMRCPDGGPAELWLDATRVDRVTVAGIVGFAD